MKNIQEYLDLLPIYIMIPLGLIFVLFIIYMDFLNYNKGSEIEPYEIEEVSEELELEYKRLILIEKLNEIKER